MCWFVHGEQRLRWIVGGLGFSVECDVTNTAMAKALLRMKFLASFLHRT